MNVFVYGTLLFPEIAIPVANLVGNAEPITVTGYRRYEAKTRLRGNFPVIVPDGNASVDGLIFRDISSRQLECLDEYEGLEFGLYQRKTATVALNGKSLDLEIYVAGPALYHRLLEPLQRSWNPILFAKQELQWYIKHELDSE